MQFSDSQITKMARGLVMSSCNEYIKYQVMIDLHENGKKPLKDKVLSKVKAKRDDAIDFLTNEWGVGHIMAIDDIDSEYVLEQCDAIIEQMVNDYPEVKEYRQIMFNRA